MTIEDVVPRYAPLVIIGASALVALTGVSIYVSSLLAEKREKGEEGNVHRNQSQGMRGILKRAVYHDYLQILLGSRKLGLIQEPLTPEEPLYRQCVIAMHDGLIYGYTERVSPGEASDNISRIGRELPISGTPVFSEEVLLRFFYWTGARLGHEAYLPMGMNPKEISLQERLELAQQPLQV